MYVHTHTHTRTHTHADQGVLCFADFYDAAGRERADRPPLVVSSTSWTPDEDFALLLAALKLLDAALRRRGENRGRHDAPPVQVVVTGKGPMRAAFEAEVERAGLVCVRVWTVWLKADDYPQLLGWADLGICLRVCVSRYTAYVHVFLHTHTGGRTSGSACVCVCVWTACMYIYLYTHRCADLGICLHTSSSGLDLPIYILHVYLPLHTQVCGSRDLPAHVIIGPRLADEGGGHDRFWRAVCGRAVRCL